MRGGSWPGGVAQAGEDCKAGRTAAQPAPMTAPTVRLGFFKLNVPEMDPALAFWREAFGFEVTMSFDEPDFSEHILALPGQPAGPNLMLVEYKDRRDVSVGPGHGPVGL